MALELAWKPENLGPKVSHVVLKVVGGPCDGTYGVYVVTSGQGHVRPVGSGRGATLEEAISSAKTYNLRQSGGGSSDD